MNPAIASPCHIIQENDGRRFHTLSIDTTMQDQRTLNACIYQLDQIWYEELDKLSGDKKLRMIDIMRDLRRLSDKLGEDF